VVPLRAGLRPVRAAQFSTVRRDEARLRPAVLALCGRLGLGGARVARFPGGSLPVYAVGDGLALKLYPPAYQACRTAEERVLRVLGGGLPGAYPARRAGRGVRRLGLHPDDPAARANR